jgi:hypothetical protein
LKISSFNQGADGSERAAFAVTITNVMPCAWLGAAILAGGRPGASVVSVTALWSWLIGIPMFLLWLTLLNECFHLAPVLVSQPSRRAETCMKMVAVVRLLSNLHFLARPREKI